jgi:hypothetical protein
MIPEGGEGQRQCSADNVSDRCLYRVIRREPRCIMAETQNMAQIDVRIRNNENARGMFSNIKNRPF